MGIDKHEKLRDHVYADNDSDLKEIVMGLHWDPQPNGIRADPENLDALCVLLDEQHDMLEIIHPGQPRNANGSVIHTGDARTGASAWDDERIFVFLAALPAAVSTIGFVVANASQRAFGDIPGASCHVSDRVSEREWIRHDLTTLGKHKVHCVAIVRRSPTGWKMASDAHTLRDGPFVEPALSALVESVRS